MTRVLSMGALGALAVWALSTTVPGPGVVELSARQSAVGQEAAAYRFEEIADDVHFAVGTGAMTVFSNSLVVINDDHVMLVDTSVSPAAARALTDQIRRELTDKPIRYVFNSHYHFDHAHGNQIFGDDVEIIGHEFVRQMHLSNVLDQRTNRSFSVGIPDQIERVTQQLADTTDAADRARLETSLRVQEAHWNAIQEVEVKPPNVTYDHVMTIHTGGREVQLRFVGRGHTGGDTMVFLPAERIVFTGDFLVGSPDGGSLSYMGDAYVDEWPDSLEQLKGLDFDIIVPGHGTPFRDRSQIDDFQSYLRAFWTRVSTLRAQGVSAADATQQIDMSDYVPQYGERAGRVDPRAVLRIYELLQVRMPM